MLLKRFTLAKSFIRFAFWRARVALVSRHLSSLAEHDPFRPGRTYRNAAAGVDTVSGFRGISRASPPSTCFVSLGSSFSVATVLLAVSRDAGKSVDWLLAGEKK